MATMSDKILTAKHWKRTLRKTRDRIATRLFDTRLGRDILISAIGPRVKTMTLDCGDHVLSFSPADYIGRKVFRKGHFERDHVDRLLTVLREYGLLRKGTVLLELGGNIGTQTSYFALSGAYRHIVTVEPDPRNFRLLSLNIADNGMQDLVTAVNCAAGDREGQLDFYLNHKNHGKSSALRQSASDEKISVPVRPVADILDDIGVAACRCRAYLDGYRGLRARCHPVDAGADGPKGAAPHGIHAQPSMAGNRRSPSSPISPATIRECLAFFENRNVPMKVADLPVEGEQFDVLFLR